MLLYVLLHHHKHEQNFLKENLIRTDRDTAESAANLHGKTNELLSGLSCSSLVQCESAAVFFNLSTLAKMSIQIS